MEISSIIKMLKIRNFYIYIYKILSYIYNAVKKEYSSFVDFTERLSFTVI